MDPNLLLLLTTAILRPGTPGPTGARGATGATGATGPTGAGEPGATVVCWSSDKDGTYTTSMFPYLGFTKMADLPVASHNLGFLVPKPGVLSLLSAYTPTPPNDQGASSQTTTRFTARVNEADSALTCAHLGANPPIDPVAVGFAQDLAHDVAVVAGDVVTLKVADSTMTPDGGTTGSDGWTVSVVYTPDP